MGRARSTQRAAGALRNTRTFIQYDFQFHNIIIKQLKCQFPQRLYRIYGELWALCPVELHSFPLVIGSKGSTWRSTQCRQTQLGLVQRQIRPYLLLSIVRLNELTKLQYDTLYLTLPVMQSTFCYKGSALARISYVSEPFTLQTFTTLLKTVFCYRQMGCKATSLHLAHYLMPLASYAYSLWLFYIISWNVRPFNNLPDGFHQTPQTASDAFWDQPEMSNWQQ